MLVGRCLNASPTLPASRSKACPQRCCAFVSSTGHQQPQVTQAAARISTTSEVCQTGVVGPVPGHLSGLLQLLEGPRSGLSTQAELNERITRCTSWEELAALYEANLDILDFVNTSTTWTRLAKLFSPVGSPKYDAQTSVALPPVREPSFRRFLAVLIDVTSQQLRLFGVQALANVMWALSNAEWRLDQHEPAVGKLLRDWCSAVHDRLPELQAPDVSNISTAIGRLDHRWRSDFVVEFYRSVLQREDLLAHLDVTTLNNLLYGMSRARRRGLTHMGPYTRRLLGQCVDQLLERPDREAAGLVPWRAAQLLYNCFKLKLRLRPNSYTVLMPLVAEVYAPREQGAPSPLDCWSMGFLTAFVEAHRNVHPAVRPDLKPLYAYVERRLPEASTSQLAMLSHAFAEMGCPTQAPFWGHLFARYLTGPQQQHIGAEAAAAGPQPLQQQQQRLQRVPEQVGPQGFAVLVDGRSRAPSATGQQQQPVPQQRSHLFHKHSDSLPAQQQVWVPSSVSSAQQQQQSSSGCLPLSARQQMEAHMQHHQQQAAQAQQQRNERGERGAWAEYAAESHLVPQGYRASHAPQPHHLPHQLRQLTQSSQPVRRSPQQPRLPADGSDRPVQLPQPVQPQQQQQQQQPQQQQQQQQQQPVLSQSEPATVSAEQSELEEVQQPQPAEGHHAQPPSHLRQQEPQYLTSHPQSRAPATATSQTTRPPGQYTGHQQADQLPPVLDLTAATSEGGATVASPWPHPGGGDGDGRDGSTALATAAAAASNRADDDLTQPRTLHYVCWQAAKAGILPPRAFLKLYVERVPQWLLRSADDKQLAQAVETLRLLRWVPRRELREALCAALERRAGTSRLPLRALHRWVRQQG